ncbi:MAG: GNAT family N-acetyltransferase [Candidatus Latescibacterota bacterium]
MTGVAAPAVPLDVHPLTTDRWGDLEALFGPHGACGGCWCMWWRCARSQFRAQAGEGNRRALRALLEAGRVPGLLGYRDGQPVGWVSVAPREEYPSLERSRVLRRLDDLPVWSLVCLFVASRQRRQGIALALVRSAVEHVRAQGGRIVEAYPTVPRRGRLPAVSSYMGVPSLYARLGFVECARPSPARKVMRLQVG